MFGAYLRCLLNLMYRVYSSLSHPCRHCHRNSTYYIKKERQAVGLDFFFSFFGGGCLERERLVLEEKRLGGRETDQLGIL